MFLAQSRLSDVYSSSKPGAHWFRNCIIINVSPWKKFQWNSYDKKPMYIYISRKYICKYSMRNGGHLYRFHCVWEVQNSIDYLMYFNQINSHDEVLLGYALGLLCPITIHVRTSSRKNWLTLEVSKYLMHEAFIVYMETLSALHGGFPSQRATSLEFCCYIWWWIQKIIWVVSDLWYHEAHDTQF